MKKFVIARAGKTIDGREITAAQIEAMATSYDPELYAARIWLEHYRSLIPDGTFKALGDVKSLSVGTDKTDAKVLLAELEPTEELKAINKASQKVYTSIEMDPNFAQTGGAYLVGLAVTDSPASLGTTRLNFSVAEKSQNELFSEFIESDIHFAEREKESIAEKVKSLFSKAHAADKNSAAQYADIEKAITEIATEQVSLTQKYDELAAKFAALQESNKALAEKYAAIDTTPAPSFLPHPPASGAISQPNY